MSERFEDNLMRDLLERLDASLREAERVRNQADQQYRDRPFWPERRRTRRDPDPDQPNSPKSTKAA